MRGRVVDIDADRLRKLQIEPQARRVTITELLRIVRIP